MVITGLTRNQLGSNPPRVRISPSPPIKKEPRRKVRFFLYFLDEIRKERFGKAELQAFGKWLQRSGACQQKVYLLLSESRRLRQLKGNRTVRCGFLLFFIKILKKSQIDSERSQYIGVRKY